MRNFWTKISQYFQSFQPYSPAEKSLIDIWWRDLVAAARSPIFYRDYAVPDRPEARFEMVVIHVYLLLARLKYFAKIEQGHIPVNQSQNMHPNPNQEYDKISPKRCADALFAVMSQDFEHNLRQMGVGDLRVGGKMRKLMAAFYGRVKFYDQFFAAGEDASDEFLRLELRRVLWGEESSIPQNKLSATKKGANQIAEYFIAAKNYCEKLSWTELSQKKNLQWPIPK